MQSPLDPYIGFLATIFPIAWLLLIVFAVLTSIWLILHVEYGDRFSVLKTGIAIIFIAIFFGFGIHLLLLTIGI
jgi:hypothetical protein